MGDFYDYDEYEEADGEVSLRDECTILCGDHLGPGPFICLSMFLSPLRINGGQTDRLCC